MDIRWWLKELGILIVMYEITIAEGDLLESFRPREDDPPEVNEFLLNVLDHKSDFDMVRRLADTYQMMRKNTRNVGERKPFNQYRQYYNNYDDLYGVYSKRNAPASHHRKHNRFKKHKMKKHHRHARNLPVDIFSNQDKMKEIKSKPYPKRPRRDSSLNTIRVSKTGRTKRQMYEPEILVEPEGEKGTISVNEAKSPRIKKSPMNFEQAPVHHSSNKAGNIKKFQQKPKQYQNGDFYYVDLGEKARNEPDKRNYEERWHSRPRYYYRAGDRPFSNSPREKLNEVYDTEPLQHNVEDYVDFERALTYEIDPKPDNNPDGNSLYSVDAGRPDIIQKGFAMNGGESKDMTDERFFIDVNNNLRKTDTLQTSVNINNDNAPIATAATTEASENPESNGAKVIKQVGEGFIEIAKGQKNEGEDLTSDILKPSLTKQIRSDRQNVIPFKSRSVVDETPKNNQRGPIYYSTVDKKRTINEDNADTSYALQDKRDLPIPRGYPDENGGAINIDSDDPLVEMKNNDNKRSNILSKHSLHPLRVRNVDETEPNFRSRKLQFVDERMMNSENEDDDYEFAPKRSRRDFLDALGMKNEEDYSEDNPYKNVIDDNNTDINNDTFYKNLTKSHECFLSSTATTSTTVNHMQKNNMNTIKQILEAPKEEVESATLGNFKNPKEEKRSKADSSDRKQRVARNIPKDLELKLLQNKDRISNYKTDQRNPNFNYDDYKPVKRGLRPENWFPNLLPSNENAKKSFDLEDNVEKRDDCDAADLLVTSIPQPVEKCTDDNEGTDETTTACTEGTVNSTYGKLAYQMDVENEKMAEVVNGQLASKIVSTVFDQLKEKTSLKTKFYSGLSRKHLDFAGTIDCDIFKANESEEVSEAQLFLEQLTKVLNKLVINQVRRKMCQRIPDDIKQYLEMTVNIKNSLPVNGFVPNPNQGDYLFNYEERKSEEQPFDTKKLDEVLLNLEALLLSYHNLNMESQNRVEVVRDYIEKHVKMLKRIMDCPSHNCEINNVKRNINYNKHIRKESRELGRKKKFVPNFDVVKKIVKNRIKNPSWKIFKKRNTKKKRSRQSDRYKKLQMAVEKVRQKREYEKKIAEMFGGKQKRSVKKVNIDYEKPIVYSL